MSNLPRPILVGVCLALFLLRADIARSGEVGLELAGLTRATDLLRISSLEPAPIPTPGLLAGLTYALGHSHNSLLLASTVGGSWQTFDGPGIQGRVTYVEWTVRSGLERVVRPNQTFASNLEAYFEYGEVNSWLKNLIVARAGPHAFHAGVGVRLIAQGPGRWRMRPALALEHSVFRAHAVDETSSDQFAWIGQSTALSIGLRLN